MRAIDQGGGVDAKDVRAGLTQSKIEVQIFCTVALAPHSAQGEPAEPADHKRADQERRLTAFGATEPFVVTFPGLDKQAKSAADDIGLRIRAPGVEQGGVAFRQPDIIMVEERQR